MDREEFVAGVSEELSLLSASLGSSFPFPQHDSRTQSLIDCMNKLLVRLWEEMSRILTFCVEILPGTR